MPVLCWQGSNTDVLDGLLGLSHCEAPNQPVERFRMGQKYRDQADPMRPGREEVSSSSGHCCPDSRLSDRTLAGLGMNASEPTTNPRPTQDRPKTAHDPIGRRRVPICHLLPNHGMCTFSRPLPFPPEDSKPLTVGQSDDVAPLAPTYRPLFRPIIPYYPFSLGVVEEAEEAGRSSASTST